MRIKILAIERVLPVSTFQWRQNHAERENLRRSLTSYGFIAPLAGFELEGQVFLIDGYERVALAHELKWTDVPVAVTDLDLAQALSSRLLLNPGPWTPIETCFILNAARQILPEADIPFKVAPLLGIQSPQILKDYAKLVELPQGIKKAYGHFPLSVLMKCFDFSEAERDALSGFLPDLSLNQNKFSEILDLIFAVCKKEKCRIDELLDALRLTQSSPADKTEALRESLRKRRNPRFEAMKEAWLKQKKALPLPPGIQVDHSPYFEEDGVILQARLKDESALQRLKSLIESEAFRQLVGSNKQN